MSARAAPLRRPPAILAFARRHAQVLSWGAFSAVYVFALIVAFS